MYQRITVEALLPIWLNAKEGQGGCCLIDVREPSEYAQAHITGSELIPLGSIPQAVDRIPADETVYLICAGGLRSAQAAQWLEKHQDYRNLVNVEGGMMAWMQAGQPTASGQEKD